MSAQQQMTELAERRRLLLLEAELHRSIIGLECQALRGRLASLSALRGQVAGGKPWFIGAAAVAGLLAARHWRKVIRWLPRALIVWRLLRKRRGI
jgi:hypothetical protein